MKILHLHATYSSYLRDLYLANPNLENYSYKEALTYVENDFMDWGRGYVDGLRLAGMEAVHLISSEPLKGPNLLLRLWARENLSNYESLSNEDILIAQIKSVRPDVLLFFMWDEHLFDRLKSECPFIKKYVGWIGSALFGYQLMKKMDLMLCCAPENIPILRDMGINAVHINHAFNPKILNHLSETKKEGCSFFGQLIRDSQFHLQREAMLEKITDKVPIKIYTPSFYYGTNTKIGLALLKKFIYYDNQILNKISLGIFDQWLNKIPRLKNITKWEQAPLLPVSLKLKKYYLPPVWGMDMFNALSKSLIALNVHADSSPRYASNMRLFETTGIGTCLLTDRKENINKLFVADKECVVYDSDEDCAEKIEWLIKHPEVAKNIGVNGQKRCLSEYTNKEQGEKIVKYIKDLV